jgi:hypothetical protein
MIWTSRVVCDAQAKQIFLIRRRIRKRYESIIDVRELEDVDIFSLAIFSIIIIFFVIMIIFESMSFV